MNLEPVIQSEVSQKEKIKYCILTHIYMESRKMVFAIATIKFFNIGSLRSHKPRVVPEPPEPGRGKGKFSLEPSEGAATLTLDLRSPELRK